MSSGSPSPEQRLPLLNPPGTAAVPAPTPASASASDPALRPALALRNAASAPNSRTHLHTSYHLRPPPLPAVLPAPEAEPGPAAWQRQMDIVTAEARKMKQMLQQSQRRHGQQQQQSASAAASSSSSSNRGDDAGPSTKRQRQNLGDPGGETMGMGPPTKSDQDRFDEMTREIEAVHSLLGFHTAGAVGAGPGAAAGAGAARPSSSASPRSYLPQIKAVLRNHTDPMERRGMLLEQLIQLLHTRETHKRSSSDDEMIKQLLEVIEEQKCSAEEGASPQARRDEARRHGETRSPAASTSAMSSGSKPTVPGSRNQEGPVSTGDSNRSLAVVSAPVSVGPHRSGNPHNRRSTDSVGSHAVRSAPARLLR
ncbi:hypothetical protein EPUS_01159 [Endocarpon pusillum Z07020]|uniref:Uncharacterized protein n=1 Tax=Endocarpon pusillum (strain Z07020 / HMAS-L-300199) TaxID=1263415 RepID=U1FWI5_ENDPU|nr:uncharacterized protein EPUS_01159 [Endocarpon pusillum Z07020]ERF69202.1 hypothetical protein EPUS_01159 [Endocarpon pusillum Z07020]